MTLEERLMQMEQRLATLEQENRELKGENPPQEPRTSSPSNRPVPKDPEEIRRVIETLTPYQRMKMKELAMDTVKYGYDAAMIMHGRKLPKRGRKAMH